MTNKISSTVYSVVFEDHGEDGFLALSPEWPEAAGAGKTMTEALKDLMDAIEEASLGRLARGEDLPAGREAPRTKLSGRVPLTPFAASKVGLTRWAEAYEHGAHAELQRRTGLDRKTITRALEPVRGKVSTDKMIEVASAAGLFFQFAPITDEDEGQAEAV